MDSIYNKYQFENKTDAMSAGYSCMTKPKYNNLVIPLGLVINPHTDDYTSQDANENTCDIPIVRSDKFDALFYSVGKNLGKPRASTLKKHRS